MPVNIAPLTRLKFEKLLKNAQGPHSTSSLIPFLTHFRLNRLEEAVSSYNDALRIDPFFVEAYNGRGNALMDFGHEDGTVLGRLDLPLVSFVPIFGMSRNTPPKVNISHKGPQTNVPQGVRSTGKLSSRNT